MSKAGRPGISYDQFVEVWEGLIKENRASNNNACSQLGCSKSTVSQYREQYERNQSAKEISFIKQIKLPETITQAIADMKLEEIQLLEKQNRQLEGRLDQCLGDLKKSEASRVEAIAKADEFKTQFDKDKLELERKLAAAEARISDAIERESQLQTRLEQVSEQYNQTKQDAVVAQKEIELLREMRQTETPA